MSDPLGKLSWDDLRIIKTIGGSGALAAAAKVLRVNTTTISRRLALVEETLGVTLFDRRRTWIPADHIGRRVDRFAERMELDIVSVARRVSGHAQGHKGELRVTTSDALLLDFSDAGSLPDFQALNPSVRVEVIVGNTSLNLARGESDIAFRAATEAPPDNLFGRKVATIAWAADGRRSDFAGAGPILISFISCIGPRVRTGLSRLKASKFVDARIDREKSYTAAIPLRAYPRRLRPAWGSGFCPACTGSISHARPHRSAGAGDQ